MTTKTKQTQTGWNEEQVTYLVELVIAHRFDFKLITREHNKRFNVRRTVKAIQGAHRRLKDAYTYQQFDRAWAMVIQHPDLFTTLPRFNKAAELEERNQFLETRIVHLEKNLTKLMSLLDNRTTPETPVSLS